MNPFEAYALEAVTSAIEAVPSAEVGGVYVVSLLVYDEEDDPRRPTIKVGYNTESRAADAATRASSEAEARWNYAFWLQNELLFLADSDSDPRGAMLCRQWIQDSGLWYSDEDQARDFDATVAPGKEITRRFVALAVRLVQALHHDSVIKRTFGRPVPVIIHELEYPYIIVEQNRVANPPELVADFARWVYGGCV